jgi:hypothetical protein
MVTSCGKFGSELEGEDEEAVEELLEAVVELEEAAVEVDSVELELELELSGALEMTVALFSSTGPQPASDKREAANTKRYLFLTTMRSFFTKKKYTTKKWR